MKAFAGGNNDEPGGTSVAHGRNHGEIEEHADRLASVSLLTLSSVAEAGNLTLAWNPNSDGNTTGYRVYWGHQSGVYGGSVDVGNVTTWRFNGLADGVPYYFVMRAYNAAGCAERTLDRSLNESRREDGGQRRLQRRLHERDDGISSVDWRLVHARNELRLHVGRRRRHSGDRRLRWRRQSRYRGLSSVDGAWYILQSSDGIGMVYTWGGQGDMPVAFDYDGDGKTDVGVFRRSTGAWYIIESSTQGRHDLRLWRRHDIPVPGDYDGDGKADVAVFRPSTGLWYISQSNTGTGFAYTFGGGADIPVPADYDGDGKTDVAVFRPGTGVWYVVYSIHEGRPYTDLGHQWRRPRSCRLRRRRPDRRRSIPAADGRMVDCPVEHRDVGDVRVGRRRRYPGPKAQLKRHLLESRLATHSPARTHQQRHSRRRPILRLTTTVAPATEAIPRPSVGQPSRFGVILLLIYSWVVAQILPAHSWPNPKRLRLRA